MKLKNLLLGTAPIWLPIPSIIVIGYVLKFLNWQVDKTKYKCYNKEKTKVRRQKHEQSRIRSNEGSRIKADVQRKKNAA